MNYTTSFTAKEPITNTIKKVKRFLVEAKNKREAECMIRTWFDIQGEIEIPKED